MELTDFVADGTLVILRYAVWVSENWRLTFAWHGLDAVDVDLEDYH